MTERREDAEHGQTILWRRLDPPGHEIATIARTLDGWTLIGLAIFVETGQPCRVEYDIRCDANWITRRCVLHGAIGARSIHLEIERHANGDWSVDGVTIPALRGCDDVDLGFSPVTNLLPIRRAALPIGMRADVRAAWVRFPELTLEILDQAYTRTDADHYAYESDDGRFRRDLTVDAFGCVVDYPGLWCVESTAFGS